MGTETNRRFKSLFAAPGFQIGWRLRSSRRANVAPEAVFIPGVTGTEQRTKQNACAGGQAHHANRVGVTTSPLLAFSEAPCLLGPLSYNSASYMADLWSQGWFFLPNRFNEKHLEVHC